MSETTVQTQDTATGAPKPTGAGPRRSFFSQMEIDTRLLGMIGAFVAICLIFQWLTGDGNIVTRLLDGRFLTPRNVFNLTIQTVSVAIMATGMVFVIVTRHIDLSVGALLATCSAVMAMLQTQWLLSDSFLGLERGHWMIPWIAIVGGIVVGAGIGAFQGWLTGYLAIPAFIVTLGGLLIWRNVAWQITNGQTIAPLDETFMIFGGNNGTLGGFWSAILAAVMIAIVVGGLFNTRRNKIAHGFPVKPLKAEIAVAAIVAAAIAGFAAILIAYQVPERVVARDPAAFGCVTAEGCSVSYGFPVSVIVLIVVAIVMTVIASRTRLGRYIFATGGNPDAAELSGINTRLLTVKVFAIMGALTAISAVVASARLTSHTNDIGVLDELRVIAAAVIGGTALAGGIGTIYGAILGALIMQSLQSGMAMVGVDAPMQNIVVGSVLVAAVMIDIAYRDETKRPLVTVLTPLLIAVGLFFSGNWIGVGIFVALAIAAYVYYNRKGAF